MKCQFKSDTMYSVKFRYVFSGILLIPMKSRPFREVRAVNFLRRIDPFRDTSKLTEILQELKEQGGLEITGFEEWELEALTMQYDHISDLLNEDFSEFANKEQKDTFTMTFSLPAEAKEAVQKYVENTENAKMEIATAIINKVKGVL